MMFIIVQVRATPIWNQIFSCSDRRYYRKRKRPISWYEGRAYEIVSSGEWRRPTEQKTIYRLRFLREHHYQLSWHTGFHRCMADKTFGTSETISRPTQVQDRQFICNFCLQTVAKLQ